MMKKGILLIAILSGVVIMKGCKKDKDDRYTATPYTIAIPQGFAAMTIPDDNPTTVEGIELGRRLFYERRLSGDNSLSCAGCHFQDNAFSDPDRFSTGIDGLQGSRNAMAIINLGWGNSFFWDGRSASLEEQALMPVEDPIEMHESWTNAVAKLQADPEYVNLFERAFGSGLVTKEHAVKAIAQFERTLISANSRFDQWLAGAIVATPQEEEGYNIFRTEVGDCFHCHGAFSTALQFGDGAFRNNGLDPVLTPGSGREAVTGDPLDRAKFKTPTLRNIEFTAPYMHDGRFQTLEEVIEFYNMGGHVTATTDPNMKAAGVGRNWTPEQKANLLAFLRMLSDPDFINNPDFSNPN